MCARRLLRKVARRQARILLAPDAGRRWRAPATRMGANEGLAGRASKIFILFVLARRAIGLLDYWAALVVAAGIDERLQICGRQRLPVSCARHAHTSGRPGYLLCARRPWAAPSKLIVRPTNIHKRPRAARGPSARAARNRA